MSIEWLRSYAEDSNRSAMTLMAVGALIHSLSARRQRLARVAAESLDKLDKIGARAILALNRSQTAERNSPRRTK